VIWHLKDIVFMLKIIFETEMRMEITNGTVTKTLNMSNVKCTENTKHVKCESDN